MIRRRIMRRPIGSHTRSPATVYNLRKGPLFLAVPITSIFGT